MAFRTASFAVHKLKEHPVTIACVCPGDFLPFPLAEIPLCDLQWVQPAILFFDVHSDWRVPADRYHHETTGMREIELEVVLRIPQERLSIGRISKLQVLRFRVLR